MGRYYTGDIEGKFWFAVQSSNDAEHFGAEERNDHIQYIVPNNQKDEALKEGIAKCLNELGNWKEGLDAFFERYKNGYNDEYIVNFWKEEYKETVSLEDVKDKLKIYARLSLGREIEEFFKENPDYDCYFEAEL